MSARIAFGLVAVVASVLVPAAHPADGPPPVPRRTFDEKTDYAKLSLDELIAALDAGRSVGENTTALAEVLRRGPDALKEALPVVRDFRYSGFNTTRMLAVLLVNRDRLDKPSALLAEFRTAAKPGPAFRGGKMGSDGNDEPLPRAIDPLIAPALAKALKSADAAEAAAAREIVGELRFLGLGSLYAEVGALAKATTGDQRKQYLDLLAKSPYGAIPVYAGFLRGDDAELRQAGLAGLGVIQGFFNFPNNPQAVAALAPLYEHKDDSVRLAALQAGFLMGDTEVALPALLKHPWPRQDTGGDPKRPAWPAYPKALQQKFQKPSPENMGRMAPAITAAVLGDGTERLNALYALGLAEDAGQPVWEKLKDAKDPNLSRAAADLLARIAKRPRPVPFEELPAEEQVKQVRASIGRAGYGPNDPWPHKTPRAVAEAVVPELEEKLLKDPDVEGKGMKWAGFLFAAGPKGEAVLAKALEAKDPKRAQVVFDAWESRSPGAHPALLPAVRKCLASSSLNVRLLAALLLAAGEEPPGPDAAKVLREVFNLCAKPAELAKALGERVRDDDEATELTAEVRPLVAGRLVLADWPNRATYLAAMVEQLRTAISKERGGPALHKAADEIIGLGPAAKDAAGDLVKVLADCRDPGVKAIAARVLRAVDTDAARRAGVR